MPMNPNAISKLISSCFFMVMLCKVNLIEGLRRFILLSNPFTSLSICIWFFKGHPVIVPYITYQSCSSGFHLPPAALEALRGILYYYSLPNHEFHNIRSRSHYNGSQAESTGKWCGSGRTRGDVVALLL